MYHPTIVQRRLNRLADVIRVSIDPQFSFHEYSVEECQGRAAELAKIFDPVAESLQRPLHEDEEAWIRHEINRCKADFLYWATRYAFLKNKHQELVPFVPTAVQTLLLNRIQDEELSAIRGETGDGILLSVLKARQLGVSTQSEIIIAHRTFFYGNTTALIAADIESRTENLYEMLMRVYNNLPWWMKPQSVDAKKDVKRNNQLIRFSDQDSVIRMGHSANMQGGDSGSDKGSLGTGQTLPLCHLSELALWANPWQIDDALMPSIPMSPRTFAIFESTAKGRGNWWHDKWIDAKRGLGRRKPVFIPWYTDPDTYKLPAPGDWMPSEVAIRHAERVRNTSSQWVGHSVDLTRDQLFWWDRTRAEYVSSRILHKFLAEYAADDMEAFQNTTVGVFPSELLDDLRQNALSSPVVVEIRPKTELASAQ